MGEGDKGNREGGPPAKMQEQAGATKACRKPGQGQHAKIASLFR